MARTPDTLERLPLRRNPTGQGLMLATLALLALGVVMVHSALASVANPGVWYTRVDMRHTAFALLAVLVLAVGWRVDYHRLCAGRVWVFPLVAGAILLIALICGGLVFVKGIGYAVGGCRRWIRIGSGKYCFSFQPSELIKLSLVIFLVAWLTRPKVNPRSFLKSVLPASVLVAAAVGLVIREDLGTGLLIAMSAWATLLFVGVPLWYLLPPLPIAALAGFIHVYDDPRRLARVQAMFDPWCKTNPSAYQPRQSLVSILSGGWFGRGLGGGMNKLGFLPEDSTDFIFATYCEEWGVAGAALLMGLVLLWMWHARRSAVRAPDPFGRALAGSLGFVIALQMVLHIAVDLVVAPPTGMSLPFVSAGGTALVIMAAATAIMISVTARQGETPSLAAIDDELPAPRARREAATSGMWRKRAGNPRRTRT